MDKNGNILITSEDFVKGMSRSPYLGIQQMVNLDIHSKPGALKIAYALTKDSGAVVDELIRSGGIEQGTGSFYGLGDDGGLFRLTSTGTWSDDNDFGTTDDGLFVWKNYVVAIRAGVSALLEAYGPIVGGSPAEQTFTSISFNHDSAATFKSIVTLDDKVFFGADNVLHELVQVDGQNFDPTDSNTYALSEEVLILPEGIEIRSITEVGSNLVIGTSYGNVETAADLFVWNPNKSGTDASAPDRRIPLGGNGIRHAIVLDNLHYSIVGNNAKFKVTDLTSVEELMNINSLSNNPDTAYTFAGIENTDAITQHDGGVAFGLSKEAAEPHVFLYKNEALTAFDTSVGQVAAGMTIGKVISLGDDQLLVAWENETDNSNGVDVTSTTSRYQNYSAYFISQLYPVGRDFGEKTYSEIGFTLGNDLAADQGIRIKYRTSLSDSWTTVGTWDFDTIGGVNAHAAQANLSTDLTNLQLRVEMTTGTSDTTPELTSVHLR